MSIIDFYDSGKSRGLRNVEWRAVCAEDGRHRGHKLRLLTDTYPPFERNPRVMYRLRRELNAAHCDMNCAGGRIMEAMMSKKYQYAQPARYYAQWNKDSYKQYRRHRRVERRRVRRIERRLRRRLETGAFDTPWCPRNK